MPKKSEKIMVTRFFSHNFTKYSFKSRPYSKKRKKLLHLSFFAITLLGTKVSFFMIAQKRVMIDLL